mmetsp:Transcript_1200/g.2416  ORF Transcript_1200/g.2416 Transcript_1200/m.2416 type:complete len:835 (-) Transcript_1200:14-2518(-)
MADAAVEEESGGLMKKSGDGTLLQLVNYEESFNEDLAKFLEARGMLSASSFRTVSVIGPQSSGKSTLLNLLFDLRFMTMDEAQGRYQVTQGVWLGFDQATSTMVLDLEGTDSRERGEDAVSFERKSALFALALSEVLLINIWTQDVGRLNASNFALLKTVLELDLQLFHGKTTTDSSSSSTSSPSHIDPECKTKLLFVLRDHVSSPLESLAKILRTDLEKIWAGIDKPPEHKSSSLADFFDVEFTSLPHKVLKPEQFEASAKELRTQFQNGAVFDRKYSRGVTSDGFAIFAESVWRTIRSNKDLDLPAQKLMVASVRCDAFSHDALALASRALDAVKANNARAFLYGGGDGEQQELVLEGRDLGAVLGDVRERAVAMYRKGAERYDEGVANAKEEDMLGVLDGKLEQLYNSRVDSTRAEMEAEFEKFCGKMEKDRAGAPWEVFGERMGKKKKECEMRFDEACGTQVRGVDEDAFGPKEARRKMVERMGAMGRRCEENVLELLNKSVVDMFRRSAKESVDAATHAMDAKMWAALAGDAEKWARDARAAHERGLGENGMALGEEQKVAAGAIVREECAMAAFGCAEAAIGTPSALELRLSRSFDQKFRFTERGVPRSWVASDDVEELYLSARDASERLVDVFGSVDFGAAAGGERELLSVEQRVQLKERVRQLASNAFLDAQRVKDANVRQTKIPAWMFGLLFVLGFNEGVAVLRNPWLLLLALLVAPLIYLYITLDLHKIVAPATRAAAEPVLQQARDWLNQTLDALGAEDVSVPSSTLHHPNQSVTSTSSLSSSSSSAAPDSRPAAASAAPAAAVADVSSEVSASSDSLEKKTA